MAVECVGKLIIWHVLSDIIKDLKVDLKSEFEHVGIRAGFISSFYLSTIYLSKGFFLGL